MSSKAVRVVIGGASILLLTVLCASMAFAQRQTVPLNGTWEIDDSISADQPPQAYTHTVPVPGLAHSARPAFADVDEYSSTQLLSNKVRMGVLSAADYAKLNGAGISHQARNWFWYRRKFTAPAQHEVAILKVSKAQFGIEVYLNRTLLGTHWPCFTAAYFDASKAVRWGAENEIVIRIGAHPGVLPKEVVADSDFEKNRWTPGIYDDVQLFAFDGPFIANVQVAPKIATGEALVQTELRNYSATAQTVAVRQHLAEAKSGAASGEAAPLNVTLAPGETKLVQQTVKLTSPHLWTPEDPFLYRIRTSVGNGDSTDTRFGMREIRFDTATQRAFLNGKPYFLRGSNITLHRFFEDPDSGTLPWDEAWLHRLLVEIPKQMHWNAFRFCIGPVPDRWLQIADENGLLIQNEYMVWTGGDWSAPYHSRFNAEEMKLEYREWMRDNWNHPSVAIWDANNETMASVFGDEIIPAVRGLDLSNRAWENSYNSPAGPDDPVEDHPYLFYYGDEDNGRYFHMTDLETMSGPPSNGSTAKTAHAMILNEYDWLWLNRDGSPTLLTKKLYPLLMGKKDSTAEERFAMQSYLLGGLTEFWRAHRNYAAVLHFVYLTTSSTDAFTADHFQDVKTLTLEPHFADYMGQAFKPLGVYVNFWHPELNAAEKNRFTVMMVNDLSQSTKGELRVEFVDAAGNVASSTKRSFELAALGAMTYGLPLAAPETPGNYTLRAVATADDAKDATISRRWVKVLPKK